VLDGFDTFMIDVEGLRLFVRSAGAGPPLLLLHGFPETHLMWREVAPLLARGFRVICADLPGYGHSGCRVPAPDHAPHSKRVMATDLVSLMTKLGFERFMVCGHDRGGRVAYRMALDHPAAVRKLALLDIVPTAAAWDRADARLALGFWPWSLLAQPAPLPEQLIGAAPEAVIDDAVGQWGSAADAFPAIVRAAYVEALRDPAHVQAICEEYRAAAGVDREHDAQDLAGGRRIACPVLALWSGRGALARWYEAEGGPLALWRPWCENVRGHAVDGGHFFPEERPKETAAELQRFFGQADSVEQAQ
jgi:haloacetate dehalogenase